MIKFQRVAVIIFASILLVVGMYFIAQNDRTDHVDVDTSFADDAAEYFATRLNNHLVDRLGQSIEGFAPTHFMQEFSQLEPEDFDEADAIGGVYSFDGENLTFLSSSGAAVSTSADGSLTNTGLHRVYYNVVLRLRKDIKTIADVNTLVSDISIIEVRVNSFEDCAAAGNPVMESYPRQCRTEDGRHFVEEI